MNKIAYSSLFDGLFFFNLYALNYIRWRNILKIHAPHILSIGNKQRRVTTFALDHQREMLLLPDGQKPGWVPDVFWTGKSAFRLQDGHYDALMQPWNFVVKCQYWLDWNPFHSFACDTHVQLMLMCLHFLQKHKRNNRRKIFPTAVLSYFKVRENCCYFKYEFRNWSIFYFKLPARITLIEPMMMRDHVARMIYMRSAYKILFRNREVYKSFGIFE